MAAVTVRGLSVDPLASLMAPSESETPEERDKRILREEEARNISNIIDEELNRERKVPKPVKILLLGKSESGKSTTLKMFQLMHSPKVFANERASWRAIIYLNIVRSLHLIMDAMAQAPMKDDLLQDGDGTTVQEFPGLSQEHLMLKRRLSPLVQVESALIRRLSPVQHGEREPDESEESPCGASLKEVAVNAAAQWKECFRSLAGSGRILKNELDWDDPNDPGRLLHCCSGDMIKLWKDPSIQQLLKKLEIHMENHAGFFLNALERVTAPGYLPTDDDILRARLKTLGVSEHRFRVNSGVGLVKDWRVYDVGGQRCQSAAWVPYFDDVDAIIFLAPISAFDQMLEEDPKVNRLLDSFQLWSSLVANELLSDTKIILFLNKYDIFKAKIEAGVRLADYVTSYKERPNDVPSTSEYLKRKFAMLMKTHSIKPRIFHCHFTTVTDTTSTTYILGHLQNTLMHQNLEDCSLT
ncbi:hypothetical protein AGABI2DRAFT_194428 [Agaricus bisporus var. bisporus H97]|uniref:hypothetical protein n=1 Tax=Agaricus bisporus var. bisporus (strain H97 / ATCC MYA-4626 / FGSC 10389) TaxID=936046 RepID=UPI00029F638C|nr:hypothetical protein AGABI2DRAFT_194428 [Agaricus bisporus var. bisporus H97]EKV44347.1 hypothetical protein AGABI2DRAFT_194428 [Agaricus bisporus var. bisporus H97]